MRRIAEIQADIVRTYGRPRAAWIARRSSRGLSNGRIKYSLMLPRRDLEPVASWRAGPGDHSVAVDPISKEIFVPFAANAANTVCPDGCIAVFADVATAVPEPSTWAMMLIGFLGLGVAFRQSRRKVSFA
jgi:hypothetical protein